MLSKVLIAGLLAVGLLLQGLPLGVCRCAAASPSAAAEEEANQETPPICPHCAVREGESSGALPAASPAADESAITSPWCGRNSNCQCCLHKPRSRTVATPQQADQQERPAPQALPPTDPLADRSGVSFDGMALAAVQDVPPARPVRILLGVWRN